MKALNGKKENGEKENIQSQVLNSVNLHFCIWEAFYHIFKYVRILLSTFSSAFLRNELHQQQSCSISAIAQTVSFHAFRFISLNQICFSFLSSLHWYSCLCLLWSAMCQKWTLVWTWTWQQKWHIHALKRPPASLNISLGSYVSSITVFSSKKHNLLLLVNSYAPKSRHHVCKLIWLTNARPIKLYVYVLQHLSAMLLYSSCPNSDGIWIDVRLSKLNAE